MSDVRYQWFMEYLDPKLDGDIIKFELSNRHRLNEQFVDLMFEKYDVALDYYPTDSNDIVASGWLSTPE